MRLRPDLYYFCCIGKGPDIGKIRHYCAVSDCPHLKAKPRKNNHRIGISSGDGNNTTKFGSVFVLRLAKERHSGQN